MWWIKDVTVTKGTTADSPVEEVVEIPIGTIERVFIFFRPGAQGYVKATLWVQEHQFLPEDPEGYVIGDNYVYDMPMDKEITDIAEVVKVVAWNTAITYDHTITVGVFVREKGRESTESLLQRLLRALVGE